jgi:hypothetical protein
LIMSKNLGGGGLNLVDDDVALAMICHAASLSEGRPRVCTLQGAIARPDLLSDFRCMLVEKRPDGAQDVSGHPDIRLLLADVDGTLVTQDKVLTEAAKEAVRELYDAGIALAITSGRPPRGMSMLIKPVCTENPVRV